MALIDRIRAWARPGPTIPTADRPAVVRETLRTHTGEAREQMNAGPPVTLPREAANFAENILIRLGDGSPIGWGHHTARIDACRRVIGDAITRADVYAHSNPTGRHATGPGSVTVGGDNHGSITTGRPARHAVADALREVHRMIESIEPVGDVEHMRSLCLLHINLAAKSRGVVL